MRGGGELVRVTWEVFCERKTGEWGFEGLAEMDLKVLMTGAMVGDCMRVVDGVDCVFDMYCVWLCVLLCCVCVMVLSGEWLCVLLMC
ncbi:hypothetical protein Tco_0795228 [Tanacetum coccineum]